MQSAETIPLDEHQRAQTSALRAAIVADIAASNGWIRFDRYMHRALYEPGLGYYAAGAAKLGPAGDFTTAPELSELFGKALAEFFAPPLQQMVAPTLLELGAGTGRLAAQILGRLDGLGLAGTRYLILEPSPDLRARQQDRLGHYGERVRWLERLPEAPFDGIVFGNEVADALPVTVFRKVDDRALPVGVAVDGDRFVWRTGAEDPEVTAAVAGIEAEIGEPLPSGYRSEVCLALSGWIGALAACIRQGGLLLIDYGMTTREYYHPDRSTGSLVCHFRHRAHTDPFLAPGLQDISAWVDFGTAARAARAAGLALAGYTTQAQFLLERLAHGDPGFIAGLTPAEQSALKTLLLPGEMGERFKLLWLTRGDVGAGLPGRDFRSWL